MTRRELEDALALAYATLDDKTRDAVRAYHAAVLLPTRPIEEDT
jgi:hypothetical protein